jgi:hypothetical protein
MCAPPAMLEGRTIKFSYSRSTYFIVLLAHMAGDDALCKHTVKIPTSEGQSCLESLIKHSSNIFVACRIYIHTFLVKCSCWRLCNHLSCAILVVTCATWFRWNGMLRIVHSGQLEGRIRISRVYHVIFGNCFRRTQIIGNECKSMTDPRHKSLCEKLYSYRA